MRTRTLLLLSVATALAILLAGGLWLFLLAREDDPLPATDLGAPVRVGDVTVTVEGAGQTGEVFSIDVELGGVDDLDGLDSFRLITGEDDLAPLTSPAEGRCTQITAATTTCALEFEVDAAAAPNLVLVMRRGEDVARWDGLR